MGSSCTVPGRLCVEGHQGVGQLNQALSTAEGFKKNQETASTG